MRRGWWDDGVLEVGVEGVESEGEAGCEGERWMGV